MSNSVKVQVDKYLAGDATVQDIVDAAQAGAGKPANAAKIIRDSEGKLVEVEVNLPEADAAGLLNAASKINENPGVSKAAAPESFTFDFNTLTPDAAFPGLGYSQGGYDLGVTTNSGGMTLEGGTGGESHEGASCLRMTPGPAQTFHQNALSLIFDVANNPTGWSLATDWEIDMHLSVEHDPTASMLEANVGLITNTPQTVSGGLLKTGFGFGGVTDPTEWAYSLIAGGGADTGGTGLTGTAYAKLSLKHNNAGIVEIYANDVLKATRTASSVPGTPVLGMAFVQTVAYGSAAQTKPFFVDSITVKVNDGLI